MLEEGLEVPDELVIELAPGDVDYWMAFWTLGRSRTTGGGMAASPNPIAFSEIVAYARTMALDVEDTVTLVQTMDSEWLAHLAAQVKSAGKRQKGKQKEGA